MGEAQPTLDDIQAAEWAVTIKPDLLNVYPNLARDDAIHRLAFDRLVMGAKRFSLVYGIRPPDDPKEACLLAYYWSEITEAEFFARFQDYVRRPIDQRMLAVFTDYIDGMIGAYERFYAELVRQAQQLTTNRLFCWDNTRIATLLEPLQTPSELAPEELYTVYLFLAEVRFEHQANLLPIPDATLGSAAGQLALVRNKAINLAALIQQRSTFSPLAPGTVLATLQKQFFPATTLRIQIVQELAAARITLAKRQRLAKSESPPPNTATEVVIQTTHCQIQATTIEKPPPATSEASAPLTEDTALVIATSSWLELALGIMPDRSVRAFIPVPAIGHRLRLVDGVVLALKGERWQILLDLASQTLDGRSIARPTLIAHLITKVSPPKQRSTVSREAAQADGLRAEPNVEAKRVRSLLADLRRELRALVKGPNDGSDTLLRDTGSAIELGFVCQVLVPDANGNYTFGLAVP